MHVFANLVTFMVDFCAPSGYILYDIIIIFIT